MVYPRVLRSYCQIDHSRHHKLLSQMVSNWIICLKSWHWLGQLIWIARKIRPQGNYKPFTPSNSPDNDSLLKIKEVKVLFIVLSCPKCQFSSLLALSKKIQSKIKLSKKLIFILFFSWIDWPSPRNSIRFRAECSWIFRRPKRRSNLKRTIRSKNLQRISLNLKTKYDQGNFLNNLEAKEKTPSLSIFWNRPENCLSPKMTPGFFEPR